MAWLDDWYGMTLEDVREYEKKMQEETNERISAEQNAAADAAGESAGDAVDGGSKKSSNPPSGGVTPTTPSGKKSWFSWS